MKSIAIIFAILITVLAVCTSIVISIADSWATRGMVGDSFGLTNAVFSGLAFAGLIYAILLQRKELSLQREELSLTRKELFKSASAQQKTAEAQKNLAVLNAYTALLTCKSSEIGEALNSFYQVKSDKGKQRYSKKYQDLVRDRCALEARVENVLMIMGGKVDVRSSTAFEEEREVADHENPNLSKQVGADHPDTALQSKVSDDLTHNPESKPRPQ